MLTKIFLFILKNLWCVFFGAATGYFEISLITFDGFVFLVIMIILVELSHKIRIDFPRRK